MEEDIVDLSNAEILYWGDAKAILLSVWMISQAILFFVRFLTTCLMVHEQLASQFLTSRNRKKVLPSSMVCAS